MKARRPAAELSHGIALISVLWVIAILTLLATAVSALSVSHRRAAARYGESVELDTLADSAIRLTIVRLLATGTAVELPAPGSHMRFQLLDGSVDVSFALEHGRVDLNSADPELLYALFAANGWSGASARAMVAKIEDWKDADDDVREGGAERTEYVAAGLQYTPRNGRFETVDELRQVLSSGDIGSDLFDSLTVYTHTRAPLGVAASEPVRRALKLADDAQLGGHRWLHEGESESATGGQLTGEIIRIRSCAQKKSYERCRSLIARLTGSDQKPVQVFAWN